MSTARRLPGPRGLGSIQEAAVQRGYVSLGTRRTTSVHEFYRYPARFPPQFVRAVIEAFTRPGELVLDPFMGGGTTLVEARLAGRLAIGADVNDLAAFVTRAKTTVHSRSSLDGAERWRRRVPSQLSSQRRAEWDPEWEEDGYLVHLDDLQTWRIRNLIAQALSTLDRVDDSKARRLVRCSILRTGQWALDMRQEVPTASEFRRKLDESLLQMIAVAREFSRAALRVDRAESSGGRRRTIVLNAGLPGLADHVALAEVESPALILTSPPYPGVYVNYHRWKIRGRIETPAPFWVADCLDGHGLSHYTMAARVSPSLDEYFSRMGAAWKDLARLASEPTWVVQTVGFREPAKDLPRYLKVMREAGFRETKARALATRSDGRLWRDVPSRRWWVAATAMRSTAPHTAREVVLFHRLDR